MMLDRDSDLITNQIERLSNSVLGTHLFVVLLKSHLKNAWHILRLAFSLISLLHWSRNGAYYVIIWR